MYDEITNLIQSYEIKGDFTYARVGDKLLSDAESMLRTKIPMQYRWFLKNYGHGGICGIETFGVGKNGKLIFADETIKYRAYSLPDNLIVIENCDFAYDTFLEYLKDRISDAIENI